MNAFRLVAADQAGPNALGLLVPPGRRTILIVRPRALPWDLLVVHADRRTGPTTTFREFGRDEAAAAVEGLYAALQRWAAEESLGHVEGAPQGEGYCVRAQIDVFPLVACLRQVGQPYSPLLFATVADAEHAAHGVKAVLRPRPRVGQEIYFNDRHFSR